MEVVGVIRTVRVDEIIQEEREVKRTFIIHGLLEYRET